ncbi:MAG: glycosyltransferase family 39 protein [Candidatus Omnitrophica bacterium]|nr:glycosyltransferase family 39 protein [Candidatus Omnitrophota bacterium]
MIRSRLGLEATLLGAIILWGLILLSPGFGPYWDSWLFYNRAVPWSRWLESWWTAESAPSLFEPRAYFPDAHRHPPLMEIGGGFCNALFRRSLGELGSCRVFVALVTSIWCAASYAFLASRMGRKAGLIAALLFLGSPRFVLHGVRFGIDGLIGALYGLATLALMGWNRSHAWKVVALVLFVLALLTKVQGMYLVALLGFWVLSTQLAAMGVDPRFRGDDGRGGNNEESLPLEDSSFPRKRESRSGEPLRRSLREALMALLLSLLALLAAFLLWPALWLDFPKGIKEYADFIGNHLKIPVYYFGVVYNHWNLAPWHYPWVFTALALPPLLVVPVAVRALRKLARLFRTREIGWGSEEGLLWVAFALPLAISSIPSVPKFDGVRLLLPAYGPMCVLAAMELREGWRWALSRWNPGFSGPIRWSLFAALGMAVLFPSLRVYPHNLIYYTPLIGGPSGAKRLGFDLDYLGVSMHRLNPKLQELARPGDVLLLEGGAAAVYREGPEGWPAIPEGLQVFRFELSAELANPGLQVFACIGSRYSDLHPAARRVLAELPALATVAYRGERLFSLHQLPPRFIRDWVLEQGQGRSGGEEPLN